ncbi:hypothetical protein HDU91_000469 [Kappamyces sp. JEL0680]|nr:hypothetical protein HDU91_000469 [Kappamyces sp. JEL0680]
MSSQIEKIAERTESHAQHEQSEPKRDAVVDETGESQDIGRSGDSHLERNQNMVLPSTLLDPARLSLRKSLAASTDSLKNHRVVTHDLRRGSKDGLTRSSGDNVVSALAAAHNTSQAEQLRKSDAMLAKEVKLSTNSAPVDSQHIQDLKNKILTQFDKIDSTVIPASASSAIKLDHTAPPSAHSSSAKLDLPKPSSAESSSFNVNLIITSPALAMKMPTLLKQQQQEEQEEENREVRDTFTLKEFLFSVHFQHMNSATGSQELSDRSSLEKKNQENSLQPNSGDASSKRKDKNAAGKSAKKAGQIRTIPSPSAIPRNGILKPPRDPDMYVDPALLEAIKNPQMYTFQRPGYVEPEYSPLAPTRRVNFNAEPIDILKVLSQRENGGGGNGFLKLFKSCLSGSKE